jgi:hypothetical protein
MRRRGIVWIAPTDPVPTGCMADPATSTLWVSWQHDEEGLLDDADVIGAEAAIAGGNARRWSGSGSAIPTTRTSRRVRDACAVCLYGRHSSRRQVDGGLLAIRVKVRLPRGGAGESECRAPRSTRSRATNRGLLAAIVRIEKRLSRSEWPLACASW